MRRLVPIFLLIAMLCGCARSQSSAQETKLILRYADNQPKNYPTTMAAQYFADLVEARTHGEIEIRVYCDGELGGEVSIMEQLCFGGIDMARLSTGTLTEHNEELALLTMPYLYKDADHMWRVLDGAIGDRLLQSVDDIIGMSWYDAGARSFYSVSPIFTLEDLQGKRIRVQESEAMSQMVALLGAEPVPMSYDQVYAALYVGKVDGAENNLPSFASMGHSIVAPYFLHDEHSRLPEMQVMSAACAQKIRDVNADYMDIVIACAKESALYERRLWLEQMADSRAAAVRQGVTITELTAEERQKFREAVQPMYDALPEEMKELVNQIRNS